MAQYSTIGVALVVKDLAGFTSGMGTIRRQMGITGAAARDLRAQTQGTGTSFINLGQQIRSVGNQLLILGFQLTFLTTGAMAATIKAAADFEATLTRVDVLTEASTESVRNWSQEILDLAPKLGATPNEFADALYAVTSAGYTSEKAIEIATEAVKASVIGLGEAGEVARAITATLQAYGEENLSAARATDVLVAAINQGNLEVDSLAPTLGRVVGIAAAVGVSFEELTAFIAAFSRTGVPAEVTVTSLRSVLTSILKPSAAAREALGQVGLSIDDVRQSIRERGLLRTLLGLEELFGDNVDQMAAVIGTARGLAGVLGVTGEAGEEYAHILEFIKDSTGIAEDAFQTFADTTAFRFKQLKGQLEAFAITIGGILLPGVNELLDRINPLVQAVSRFAELHPQLTLLAGSFTAILTAIGPVLIIVGLMISSFGTLVTAIGSVIAAVASLLNPLGLMVAGFAAAAATVGGLFLLSFSKIQRRMDETGKSLSDRAWTWGANIIHQLAVGMVAAIGSIVRALNRIGQVILEWLGPGSPPKLLPDLPEWGKSAMEEFMKGWADADLFSVFDEIGGTIEGLLRSLDFGETGTVPAILKMRNALSGLVDEFRRTGDVASSSISRFADKIGVSKSVIRDYVDAVFDLARAEEAVAEAQDAVTAAQENIDAINKRFATLLKPIDDELAAIEERFQSVRDSARKAELEKILADPRSNELQRELARLELRRIDLAAERRDIVADQDKELEVAQSALDAAQEALDAAQKEVDLAQERVDALEALIKQQTSYNNLVKEQIDLLEALAKKAKDAGADLSGTLTGWGEAADDAAATLDAAGQRLFDKLFPEEAPQGILSPFDKIKPKLQNIFDDIVTQFETLQPDVDAMTTTWSQVFTKVFEEIAKDQNVVATLTRLVSQVLALAVADAGSSLASSLFEGIAKGFTENLPAALDAGGALIDALGEAISADISTADFVDIWRTVFGVIGDALAIEDIDSLIGTDLEDQLTGFPARLVRQMTSGDAIQRLAAVLVRTNPILLIVNTMRDLGKKQGTAIGEAIQGIIDDITGWFTDRGDADWGRGLQEQLEGVGGGFSAIGGVIEGVGIVLDIFRTGPVTALNNFINNDLVPTIQEKWQGATEALHGAIEDLQEFLSGLFSAALTNLRNYIENQIVPKLSDWYDVAVDVLDDALTPLRNYIEDTLLDTLGTLGDFLGIDLLGAFTTIKNFIVENFNKAIDSLSQSIQGLIDKVITLLNLLPGVDIPKPWEQNSPSPFEQSIMDVSSALDDLSDRAIPNYIRASSAIAAPQAQASNTTTNTINMGGQTLNRGVDIITLQIALEQALRNVLQ